MRQKSHNENIKAREQSKGEMTSNIDDIDDLLDDEGWDILNSLTEEEIAELNSDFDPENMLIPTGERVNHERHVPSAKPIETKEIKPQFSQKDLVKTMDSMLSRHQRGERTVAPVVNSTLPPKENSEGEKTMFNQKELVKRLDAMVEKSKPVIQNEKIRQKEVERQKQKEEELDRKYDRTPSQLEEAAKKIILTEEEEELLADATEEELMEAAALLNMNDILTADQINAVFAGDKPTGGMSSNVKGTAPKQARITKADVETDLDVVVLNKHLKADTDDLFYLCVNNQPKLERQTLELIISSVETSTKLKHLSLAMIGLVDKQCIALSHAISCNKQIETLNLDSNMIGMAGIDALMNAISEHPTIREIKVSNQKQPFGGQGEECMASAIVKNQNILKFGYSFKQAAPRNKADRAIIRNNEIMRQKRRNGEIAYDLKTVCKIRDPWPQPWIRIKGQRLLGNQLESKVTDMGLMIDPDAETGRESRGPKIREEREAKPLDIAALLAARANKLKGTKVADLDKDTEERRKKTLLAMKQSEEESGKVGTMLKKGTTPVDNELQPKSKETRSLGNKETTPPVGEEDKKTKNLRGKGVDIASLKDDGPLKRKTKEKDDKVGIDFNEIEKEKADKRAEEEKKKGKEIAPLDNVDSSIKRKGKKYNAEDDVSSAPAEEKAKAEEIPKQEKKPKESPKPEKKDLRGKGGIKIAAFEEAKAPGRRRKKFGEEDEGGVDFNNLSGPTKKKEEEKKIVKEEPTKSEKAVEEKVEKVKEVKEEEPVPGKAKGKPEPSPEPSPKPEKKDWRKGGIKIAQLDDDKPKMPTRRKKKTDDEEPQGLDLSSFKTAVSKKEEKIKPVEQIKAEPKPSPEAAKPTPEDSKKKLSLEGGAKIVARFDEEEVTPRRRKKMSEEEKAAEKQSIKVDYDKLPRTISKLDSPDTIRRKEKEAAEEEIDPFRELEKRKKIEEQERKESEERVKKEEEERKIQEEEEKKRKFSDLSLRKASLPLEGGKTVAPLAPLEDATPVRRRKPKVFDDEPEPDFLKTASKEEPKKDENSGEWYTDDETKSGDRRTAETPAEKSAEKPLSAAEERAKALKERRESLAAKKSGTSPKPATETAASDKPLSAAEQRAKALKERREALAAKKAGTTPQPSDTPLSAAEEGAENLRERREALAAKKNATTTSPASDKTLSATEERAEALRERREALAAKRNVASTTSTTSASDKPLSSAEERARSLKERREKLAQRKVSSSGPTTETTAAVKPKVDVASSLASSSGDSKTLSLKERRALLAEKKRQMGK